MHLGARLAQLLDHEPPARRRLERDLQFLAAETVQKRPHALAVRRPIIADAILDVRVLAVAALEPQEPS
jgi:hypothetical protein